MQEHEYEVSMVLSNTRDTPITLIVEPWGAMYEMVPRDMNGRDLAMKFTAYAHYIASREWAKERSLLPQLVCIAPDRIRR